MKKHNILAIPLAVLALAAAPAIAGNGKVADKDKAAHVHSQHVPSQPGNSPKADGHHDHGKHKGWEKQAWKRGDRIPLADIEPRYYINDYRAYRLQAPPAGYRWVRPTDNRYLLVNVASGLVAQALGY